MLLAADDEELEAPRRRKVAQTMAARAMEEQKRREFQERVAAMVASLSRARPQSTEYAQEAEKRALAHQLQHDAIASMEEARAEAAAARRQSMEQDRKSLAKKHQLLLPTSQAMAQVTRKPHKVVAPSERGRRREASLSLLGEGFSGPARRHELTKLAAARQQQRTFTSCM